MPTNCAPAKRPTIDRLLLAGCSAFLFFFGLNSIGLAGADEPRYAQIAREMLARHDWVTPVLNGKPWLEKPVLYYWEAMISYRLLGVSDWAARLPAAVDALALVLAVYWFMGRFGLRLGRPGSAGATAARRAARIDLEAALILASMAGVIGFGHAASTDMPLAATFGIAMLFWMAWWFDRRRLWLLVFYVFLGLGTLAKGPIAPFLAGLILLSFALLRRAWDVLRTLWWPGVLLYLAVAAPWYLLVQHRTGNFFRVFLWEHNLERFATPVFHHPEPFWYFGPILLLAAMPWTVIALAGFALAIRRSGLFPGTGPQAPPAAEADLNLLLLLWAVLPTVFFSLSHSKLPGYILPAVTPFALLAALWLERKLERAEPISFPLLLLHALMAGTILTSVLLAPFLLMRQHPPLQALAVSVLAGLAVIAVILLAVRRAGLPGLRFATLLPVIVSMAFLLRVAAPALDYRFTARPLAQDMLRLMGEPEKPPRAPAASVAAKDTVAACLLDRDLEYGLNFYLDRPIERYERGEAPAGDHLLLAPAASLGAVTPLAGNRRFTLLGNSPHPGLSYFWVTSDGAPTVSPPIVQR